MVPAFRLMTYPDSTHGLCGDIEYEFLVDEQPVPTVPDADNPVGFDQNGPRKIGIESNDPNDEGTKVYKIKASLKNYPEDTDPDTNPPTAEEDAFIIFEGPCATLSSIEAQE